MLNKGHGADSLVYNNLISGFLNLENLDKANGLFDELKERCLVYDGVVNATLMDWFFNRGREKEAMESYKSLLDKQFRMIPATCNVLLEVLLKHGKKTEAWALFDQMLDNHTPPNFQAVNSETFNIMVNECFKLGKIDEALATFRKVGTKVNSKPFAMDVAGYNNIITRYCENGMLSEAETLFTELCSKSLSPDVNTYRTLIDAYLKVEQIDDALQTFKKMVEAGLRVVASFGNRVFEELIKNGKAVDCAQILKKMGEKDPKPDASCYDVVIKGLCNGGSFDLSRDLLEEMIRYGIGITPALQQFVNEAFGKVGRGEEIERVLSMNRWGYTPPSRMTGPRQQQPFRRAELTGPGQMSALENSSLGHSQRTGFHQPPSGPARMAGPYQMASEPPQVAASQNTYSVSTQIGSQHPPSGPPQMGRPHYPPLQSPQMGGQHHLPSGSPQVAQPQHPPSVSNPKMAGPHQNLSRPPQVAEPLYPPQMGGAWHHPSGPSQMQGFQQHHPLGPPQIAGPSHHQMSQSPQMAGWHMGAPQHPPSGPSQMEGRYNLHPDSCQMSGQQQLQSESHQPQLADKVAAA